MKTENEEQLTLPPNVEAIHATHYRALELYRDGKTRGNAERKDDMAYACYLLRVGITEDDTRAALKCKRPSADSGYFDTIMINATNYIIDEAPSFRTLNTVWDAMGRPTADDLALLHLPNSAIASLAEHVTGWGRYTSQVVKWTGALWALVSEYHKRYPEDTDVAIGTRLLSGFANNLWTVKNDDGQRIKTTHAILESAQTMHILGDVTVPHAGPAHGVKARQARYQLGRRILVAACPQPESKKLVQLS